jgi:microcystin-dependent protein
LTEAVVAQRNTVSAEGFVNPLTLAANAEEASHVKVYGDDVLLTLGVDYTLDGVGDVGDLDEIAGVEATIETAVLLADLYSTFTIEHDPPADQDSDLTSGGVLGRLYTGGLDAIMRRVQSIKQLFVDRALTLPVDAVDVDVTLPLPEDRRGLVWSQDQDTGEWSLVNSYSDPDTEPLTNAEEAAAAAAASEAAAEAAAAEALAQALLAADAADRAEDAAAEAGDLTALLAFLWPVGAYMMFAGAAAPANFLACNGAAVSRATYSALFAVIGTTYGAGDGSTTFNLPTLNDGRFMRSTGGNAAAQGAAAQAELVAAHSHGLTIDSGGAHTHTYGPKQGVYGANNDPYGSSDFRPSVGDSSGSTTTLTTSSNGAHTHTGTVAPNVGTENRPRNSSVLVCIKY